MDSTLIWVLVVFVAVLGGGLFLVGRARAQRAEASPVFNRDGS